MAEHKHKSLIPTSYGPGSWRGLPEPLRRLYEKIHKGDTETGPRETPSPSKPESSLDPEA